MKTILSNDIKKGAEIVLKNGWTATIMDNKKGNIRLAQVRGFCIEIGSIYVHDIAVVTQDNEVFTVALTEKQQSLKKQVNALGF